MSPGSVRVHSTRVTTPFSQRAKQLLRSRRGESGGRLNSRRPRVPRHGMYPRASSAVPVRCSVRSAGEQPDHPVTPIDPVYWFGEAGAPITLYRGPLVIGSGKPADGHIWLRLSGELEVLWEADQRCALGPTTLMGVDRLAGWARVVPSRPPRVLIQPRALSSTSRSCRGGLVRRLDGWWDVAPGALIH